LIVWSQGLAPVTASAPAAKTRPQPTAPIFGADQFYDAGDQGCAMGPMDEIAAIVRKLAQGQALEIHASDPTVAIDLAAWCRMTGNVLVEERAGHYLVRKS
jgi:TusA-related sulfurtransferase